MDGWLAAAELVLDDKDLTEIAAAVASSGAGTARSRAPALRRIAAGPAVPRARAAQRRRQTVVGLTSASSMTRSTGTS